MRLQKNNFKLCKKKNAIFPNWILVWYILVAFKIVQICQTFQPRSRLFSLAQLWVELKFAKPLHVSTVWSVDKGTTSTHCEAHFTRAMFGVQLSCMCSRSLSQPIVYDVLMNFPFSFRSQGTHGCIFYKFGQVCFFLYKGFYVDILSNNFVNNLYLNLFGDKNKRIIF